MASASETHDVAASGSFSLSSSFSEGEVRRAAAGYGVETLWLAWRRLTRFCRCGFRGTCHGPYNDFRRIKIEIIIMLHLHEVTVRAVPQGDRDTDMWRHVVMFSLSR